MITEIGEQPLTGKMLNRVFHDVIASVTGLDATHVRPAYQFEPPLFDENIDWCAFRSTLSDTSYGYYSEIIQVQGVDTYTVMHDETITLRVSLYGPSAMANAAKVKDSFYVDGIWEYINSIGIRRKSVTEIESAPDLIDEHWISHYDVVIEFNRQVKRTYSGIGHIETVVGTLNYEKGVEVI